MGNKKRNCCSKVPNKSSMNKPSLVHYKNSGKQVRHAKEIEAQFCIKETVHFLLEDKAEAPCASKFETVPSEIPLLKLGDFIEILPGDTVDFVRCNNIRNQSAANTMKTETMEVRPNNHVLPDTDSSSSEESDSGSDYDSSGNDHSDSDVSSSESDDCDSDADGSSDSDFIVFDDETGGEAAVPPESTKGPNKDLPNAVKAMAGIISSRAAALARANSVNPAQKPRLDAVSLSRLPPRLHNVHVAVPKTSCGFAYSACVGMVAAPGDETDSDEEDDDDDTVLDGVAAHSEEGLWRFDLTGANSVSARLDNSVCFASQIQDMTPEDSDDDMLLGELPDGIDSDDDIIFDEVSPPRDGRISRVDCGRARLDDSAVFASEIQYSTEEDSDDDDDVVFRQPCRSTSTMKKPKKRVSFADESSLVTIYCIERPEASIQEAYDTYMLDRMHFRRRVENESRILLPVLDAAHRLRIYNDRFRNDDETWMSSLDRTTALLEGGQAPVAPEIMDAAACIESPTEAGEDLEAAVGSLGDLATGVGRYVPMAVEGERRNDGEESTGGMH